MPLEPELARQTVSQVEDVSPRSTEELRTLIERIHKL